MTLTFKDVKVVGFSANNPTVSSSATFSGTVSQATVAIKSFSLTNDRDREAKFIKVGIDSTSVNGSTVNFVASMSYQNAGIGDNDCLESGIMDVVVIADIGGLP
ncbi:hypothetical protein [Okeania sp. SIO2B3]|uniref:hypothetical protein n=1 Tax=Okeania sp. SIO2B3 TaxID=2607784 RepID=UPI0013BFCE1F|nr:hypothetical protein [Okeania sp. SIO2B3]NET44030.1 hypothetical protein [Okeania sp. SIO2B3]